MMIVFYPLAVITLHCPPFCACRCKHVSGLFSKHLSRVVVLSQEVDGAEEPERLTQKHYDQPFYWMSWIFKGLVFLTAGAKLW